MMVPRRRAWFDQGCDAFKRSFPEISEKITAERFYVCPICLIAFGDQALASGFLTREDVPPKSIGGRKLALTCKQCNSEGGHGPDSHARREADFYAFAAGDDLRETKAGLRTASGRVPIRLSVSDRKIQMRGVPAATDPVTHARVKSDFETAMPKEFTFKVELPAFSPSSADASWLRSAYLAFFAALGYRFIFRRELDVVRAKILDPKHEEPRAFRIVRPDLPLPSALIRIDEPEALRSFAMFYGRNVVFLPRYNDHEFYARFAELPEITADLSGIQYPWPVNGPTFFHDRSQNASLPESATENS